MFYSLFISDLVNTSSVFFDTPYILKKIPISFNLGKYEGGLKGSYKMTSYLLFMTFFDQLNPSTATLMEEVCGL